MARGKGPEVALKALVFADECDNCSFPAVSATSYLLSKLLLVWQLFYIGAIWREGSDCSVLEANRDPTLRSSGADENHEI